MENDNNQTSLLQLPKDLLKKLMFEYFDPLTVVRCFRVSKMLKSLVSDKELKTFQVQTVKQIIFEKQLTFINNYLDTHCQLCGEKITKEYMVKHIKNHEKKIEQGEMIKITKDICDTTGSCEVCEAPGPNCGPHRRYGGCPLQIVKCNYHFMIDKNPWAEFACPRTEGYTKQINGHQCAFRCKKCKQLFPLFEKRNENGKLPDHHLEDCEYRTYLIKY
jgi:hypothetical protein